MHVRLLFWSLRHRKGRHVISALAMAITAGVFMLFVAVMANLFTTASHDHPKDGLARLMITPKLIAPGTTADGMPMSFYNTFQAIDGVKEVQRRLFTAGRHPSGATYTVGGEEEAGIEYNPDMYPVTPAQLDAWKQEKEIGAIVTDVTARDLHLQLGEVAEIPTGYGVLRIKPVAITHGALIPQLIAVHFDYLQEFAKNLDTCGYRVYTSGTDSSRVAAAIADATKNSVMPVQAVDSNAFRVVRLKQAAAIPAVLGFLGLFLILTTGLTLANNSAISIRERRIEAATFRVLGYHRRTIASLFVGEAILIGVLGGLFAIVVMSVVFHSGVKIGAGLIPGTGLLETVKVGGTAMAGAVILSILVPLAGALPAALVSLRVPLVEGLRDSA